MGLAVGERCGMDQIGTVLAGIPPEVDRNTHSVGNFISEEALTTDPIKQSNWCNIAMSSSNAQSLEEAPATKAERELGTTLGLTSAPFLSAESSTSWVQTDQSFIEFPLKQHCDA